MIVQINQTKQFACFFDNEIGLRSIVIFDPTGDQKPVFDDTLVGYVEIDTEQELIELAASKAWRFSSERLSEILAGYPAEVRGQFILAIKSAGLIGEFDTANAQSFPKYPDHEFVISQAPETPATPWGIPQNVSINESGLATWSPVETADGYHVSYTVDGGTTWKRVDLGETGNEFDSKEYGLITGTSLQFPAGTPVTATGGIRAVRGNENSEWSENVTV